MQKAGRKKEPLTKVQKKAVKEYLESTLTLKQVGAKYGVSDNTIRAWRKKYEEACVNSG